MNISSNGYYKNRHSCYLLQYHLVLVTKYRKPAIQGAVEEELRQYFTRYFKDRDLKVQAMKFMPDHVHILFDAKPNMNLGEFVNALKSASSRRVRKLFPKELGHYYWKPYFWSLSYFIGSVSDRTAETVRTYIQNQKDKD